MQIGAANGHWLLSTFNMMFKEAQDASISTYSSLSSSLVAACKAMLVSRHAAAASPATSGLPVQNSPCWLPEGNTGSL